MGDSQRSVRALRGLRTKERKYLSEIQTKVDELEALPVDQREVAKIEVLLKVIKGRCEKMESIDNEILAHADLSDNEIDREIEESHPISVSTANTIAQLEVFMKQCEIAESAAKNALMATPSDPPIEAKPTIVMGGLPPLDISPDIFDGTRIHYRSFKTQFEHWVARRAAPSDTDRLIALRKLIRGEPKRLIELLAINDDNYKVALKLLDENYGGIDIERQQLMAKLFNLPKVNSYSDTQGLRNILNLAQASLRALETLNCPVSSFSLSFDAVLRGSIPSKLIFDFTEMKRLSLMAKGGSDGETDPDAMQSNSDPSISASQDIKELLAFISRYVSHREQAALLEQTNSHSSNPNYQNNSQNSGNHRKNQRPGRSGYSATAAAAGIDTCVPEKGSVSATSAGVTNAWEKKAWPCLFCKSEEHRSSRCVAQMSVTEKLELLNKLNRCIVCFGKKHDQQSQCSGPKAPCKRCKSKKHYTTMHIDGASCAAAALSIPDNKTTNLNPIPTQALMYTASAFVVSGGSKIPVRLFLDQGSSITFVDPDLMKQLPPMTPLHRADIDLNTVSGKVQIQPTRYRITLQSTNSDEQLDLLPYEHKFGVDPTVELPDNIKEVAATFSKEHQLADRSLLGDMVPTPPVILVGFDQFYRVAYVGRETAVTDQLVARETRLGWVIGGPMATVKMRAHVASIVTHCCAATMSKSARDIERLWKLEEIGICESTSSSLSADEEAAVKQFNENIQYDGESYTVTMPRRATIGQLSNNKSVALNRLESKLRSLRKDATIYKRYDEEMWTFMNEHHAEEITEFELSTNDSCDGTYYIPHHQVITKTNSGDRWRIVYDCSSAANKKSSLNSHLLNGPNKNPDLVKLLINFRLYKVALSADVVKAYLCIFLAESDRPLFRFLWQGPDDSKVRCFQMKKVIWGAAPSGFLLAATLRHHLQQISVEALNQVDQHLYHDDLLRSFNSDEEAITFINNIKEWLASANMKLAKWKTSSPAVLKHLETLGFDKTQLQTTEDTVLKILGLTWSPVIDEFRFALNDIAKLAQGLNKVSKRAVLRLVASVFDPLGWLIPFMLRGKLILQRTWSHALQWDQVVTSDIEASFREWASEIQELLQLRIPRRYTENKNVNTTQHLHIFGDASELACSAIVFMESRFSDGTSETTLVMSKSRLAPKDKQSIPRLELLAALLCTRLRKYVESAIVCKIDSVKFYTDSMITYYWCTGENPGRWKTFVSNRVTEIRQNSSPSEWYYIPGEENIADFATRGVTAKELVSNAAWWKGPHWLEAPQEQHPTYQPRSDNTGKYLLPVDSELRAVAAPVVVSSPLLDLEKYSSLESATRIVANVLKYIHCIRKQQVPSEAELLWQAELRMIKWTQERYFKKEIDATSCGERVLRSSKLGSFELFIDDNGLLRAKTRLTLGPHFSYDEKNPFVIPGESRLATLLILHKHRINAHFGTNTILASLRKKYWITRGRQVIKRLLRSCVVCKKRHGSSGNQTQAPLPVERITLTNPFATTGLDFCGPFYTRHKDGTKKNYIALFTCAATRALHLELVPSMTAPQTHLALRRFFSSYPGCTKIISDNGRSFVKVAADLKKIFNSMKEGDARTLLKGRRVSWEFICPRAPHMGGFYERMVGTVKSALTKTLGRSLLDYEELRTILSELAATINDRPLTYSNSDPEAPTPLTPAHFIRGGAPPAALSTVLPLDTLGPGLNSTAADLRTTQQLKTKYFAHLSVRWYREYIMQLRTANLGKDGSPRIIKDGDICLLKEDNVPRLKWNMVRVEVGHPGRDDAIRTYTVRFSNGNVSRRAAQLLYPLEVA